MDISFMRMLCLLMVLGASLVSPIRAFSIQEKEQKGTLIVTYRTDTKGERLNRIRFWLKEESDLKYRLYPKGKSFVDDPKEASRMVVVEDLPAGNYLLQFLVPNTDRYFRETPIREVVLSPEEVVKIDQTIKPLRSVKEDPEATTPLENTQSEEPAAAKTPLCGKLILSYKSNQIADDALNIRLIDSKGVSTVHPEPGKDVEVPLKEGKMIMIPSLPADHYRIEFYLKGEDQRVIHTIPNLIIEPEKTQSVFEMLDDASHTRMEENPSGKEKPPATTPLMIAVTTNIPTALLTLEKVGENLEWKGEGREHTFDDLCPGEYLLSFESLDPFFVPPETIRIQLLEETECIDAVFPTLGKLKILTNIETAEAFIEDIDRGVKSQKIPIAQGIGIAYLPEGDYRVSFIPMDVAHRSPHPIEVGMQPLQMKTVTAHFEKEQTDHSMSSNQ